MEVRTSNNKWWWQLNSSSTLPQATIKWYQVWIHQVKTPIVEILKSQKLLLKPNLESRDKLVVQAIQLNMDMRTACQYREMEIIKTWMPLFISITTERDLSKEVLVILQIKMQWMLLWILATLLEEMVLIAMLQVETTQP
jgi:hypothetical protein